MTRVHWLFVTLATGSVTALAGVLSACGGSSNPTNDTTLPDASVDVHAVDVYQAEAATDSSPTMDAAEEPEAESGPPPGADGGPPSVSKSKLDFGMVPCGGTPASPQNFVINNPSYAAVTWTASAMTGVNFQVAPTMGTLNPGQSVQVTVTPNPVPFPSSTSANALGDTVNVTLNGSSVTVALDETAQGAVLSFNPTTVPFGSTPISGGAISSYFGVENQGNATISNLTLTLTPDSSSGSTSTFALSGYTVAQIASGMYAQLQATFTPMDTIAADATISVSLGADAGTTGLCAPLPAALTLSGTGTNAEIGVSPAALTFTSDPTGVNPYVQCGYSGIAQTVTIDNTGSANAAWSYSLLHGNTYYTVALGTTNVSPGTMETVDAMSSQTLTITPKALPGNPSTAPNTYDDTLTITTNASGDVPHTVALHQTAQGAIITRSTNTLGFGNVAGGTTNTQSYSFANSGNLGITLVLANGNSAFTELNSPITIGPASNGTPTDVTESVEFQPATPVPPATTIAYTDTGTVTAQTPVPLCGALPGNLSLTGTGTLDTLSVSPNTINFGTANCNGGVANPASLTFTVTNNGPATSFDVAMKNGNLVTSGGNSLFTVTGPPQGDAGAGGTGTLPSGISTFTVAQAAPVPAIVPNPGGNPYNDQVLLTPGAGSQLTVTVDITTVGAILAFSPKTLNFPTTASGSSASNNTLTLTNTGNYNISGNVVLGVTTTAPAGATNIFGISGASGPVFNGFPLNFTATFSPMAVKTSYAGNVSVVSVPAGTPLCEPTPSGGNLLSLTGTSM